MNLFEAPGVRPLALRSELLLTFEKSLHQGDPATTDDSNTRLFNRVARLVDLPKAEGKTTQAAVDAFCTMQLVPEPLVEILSDLQFSEFVASAYLRLFADIYNKGEGVGIFEGMARWERLENRVSNAAVRATSLRGFWEHLCDLLKVPVHPGDYDVTLIRFWSLPKPLQAATLRSLGKEARSLSALARAWHDMKKSTSEKYAAKAGRDVLIEQAISFEASAVTAQSGGRARLEVPHVSENSLRHVCVRAPGFSHMASMLGLKMGSPGEGEIDLGTEAMFRNGGNLRAGAKEPANSFVLGRQIRRDYPILDLLGGNADAFGLGESLLKPTAWIVCAENKAALQGTAAYGRANADVSIFEMLDDATGTRMEVNGRHQMIHNFETLCENVEIFVRFTMPHFASELARGALGCAVDTFLANAPVVGGSGARGFGHLRGEWLEQPEGAEETREAYEKYLQENRDKLRLGLTEGTLNTDNVVCS